jgi:hypothetical protein
VMPGWEAAQGEHGSAEPRHRSALCQNMYRARSKKDCAEMPEHESLGKAILEVAEAIRKTDPSDDNDEP